MPTRRKKYDQWLLAAVLGIVAVGIIMVTSVGVPKSIDISMKIADVDIVYPDCDVEGIDCYLILKNHVTRVLIGLVAMLFMWKINYKWWKKLAPIFYITGVGLLVFVLATGSANNTFARSWINFENIPIINSLQPSEVMKFGLIMMLSYYFGEKMSIQQLQKWEKGFLHFAVIAGAAVGLILLQPDFGSGLVLVSIAAVMYWLSGANWRHFAVGAAIFVVFSSVAISVSDNNSTRFKAFFNPDAECHEGDCWQTRQANIAIGSGGVWGKGLTQGIQKSYWLPQAVDDFIFAASAEELGFFRSVFVVLLYTVIAWRGFQISHHAPNKFAMLLAAGVSTWISAQAFLNIMVNTALFPITGITLPFMSYGGSSMVTTLAAVGVLLNISQYTKANAYRLHRGGNGRSRRSQSRTYRRAYLYR